MSSCVSQLSWGDIEWFEFDEDNNFIGAKKAPDNVTVSVFEAHSKESIEVGPKTALVPGVPATRTKEP